MGPLQAVQETIEKREGAGRWARRSLWTLLVLNFSVALLAGTAYLWLRYVPPPSLPQSSLLAPVSAVAVTPGRGTMTITWTPVADAVSYQVERSTRPDGPFALVSSTYGKVPIFLANLVERVFPGEPFGRVPHGPFVDTDIEPGRTYYYRVAGNDGSAWSPRSTVVAATAEAERGAEPGIRIQVNAAQSAGVLRHNWKVALGSEHLSYMLKGDINQHLRAAGAGLRQGNKLAHDTLGIQYIRAHGIFMDDPSVYTEDAQGDAHYDWSKVDRLYDMLRQDGLKPFVELSFMPQALASNPRAQGIFEYHGNSSPPKSYAKWQALVSAFAQHLIDRYGRAEVESWYFEVWNEPDNTLLPGFWSGTRDDYFRLYDYSAAGLKAVDPELRVGGPVTAFTTFQEPFLRHITTGNYATGAKKTPLDFLDMHNYYLAVPDYRPLLRRYGLPNVPVYFTEWGLTPQYGDSVTDTAYGAAATLGGLFDSLDQAASVSYWTASDYFEESGNPKALFHGGFGMIGLDGLRKARYWAYYLLHRLGAERIAVSGEGDGFGGLVKSVATRFDDGSVSILMENATQQHARMAGDAALARHVTMTVTGLAAGKRYQVEHDRIDNTHSNVYGAWQSMGSPAWPDAAQMAVLHQRDALQTLTPLAAMTANARGEITLDFDMPMPAVSFIRLTPAS
jgi:xylan 1,4-beta-xylosidase